MCKVLVLHACRQADVSVHSEHDCHTSTMVVGDDDDSACMVLGQHACGQDNVTEMTEHDCTTATKVDDDDGTMYRVDELHIAGQPTCRQ